jgi:uncharacterized membrane protein affecting hemolysin expression
MGEDRAFTLSLNQVDDLNWELHKQDALLYAVFLMNENEDNKNRLACLINLLSDTHKRIESILNPVFNS